VGVIPEDWQAVQLRELGPFVTSGSRGWAEFYSEHGALFVRITNLSRATIYLDLTDSRFVTIPGDSGEGVRTSLRAGDVLISITADIGIVGYVDGNVPLPAYINQHIALVRFDPAIVDEKYVAYFLSSENPQRLFRASTDSGAKAGMSLQTVQLMLTALPPIAEQHAIASALSDVDALLEGLTRLIAKKLDLKQAAMQQLLTGQTRLPGFTGEWESKEAGRIGEFKGGSGFPQNSQGGHAEGIPFYKVSDMNNPGNEIFMSAAANEISNATRKRLGATLFARGTIIFAKVGAAIFLERKRILSRASCIDNNLVGFNVDTDLVDIRFAHYLLCHISLGALVSTTALPSLSGSILSRIVLSMPPLKEQAAIVETLCHIDAEIDALEARREKTVALKLAMMQELLTGRTRLV
jgi:type I restriction enzyme S subunit